MQPYLLVLDVTSDISNLFPSVAASPPSLFGQLPDSPTPPTLVKERTRALLDNPSSFLPHHNRQSRDGRQGAISIQWIDFPPMSKDDHGAERVMPSDLDFTTGTTPLFHGTLHLYRHTPTSVAPSNNPSSPPDKVSCTLVCLVAIPVQLTPADLLTFLSPSLHTIRHIRLLHDPSPHRYMALCALSTPEAANEFIHRHNGQAFSELDPEICHALPISSVSIREKNLMDQASYRPGKVSPSVITELPLCPVCLERMDATITGLLTIACHHTFHCRCMLRWESAKCPICRFSHLETPHHISSTEPGDPSSLGQETQCEECGTRESLWICLVCGHLGCGRYGEAHAWQHYKESGHVYAQEVETQRVWDYAGDGYVHRLLQNRVDGKLVELPPTARNFRSLGEASNADPVYGMWEGREAGEAADKVDAMAFEYTTLLTAQLETQREYYESRIDEMERRWTDEDANRVQEERVRSELAKEMEETQRARERQWTDQVETLQREAEAQAQRLISAQSKNRTLEALVRTMQRELAEEREMDQGLRHNHEELKAEMSRKTTQIDDLTEQVHDLMVYMETRDRVERGGLSHVDLDAPVELRATEPSPPSSSRKGKGKGKKKA
ncbi:hypothetical protein BJ684DRAFT_9355 [Piptocephalis cylindrospora]|uniref:BRCA1-associated protein 2-domain-containing protein n=1 Tax=Piptocephalis cylindrospora TaxID=1907219 RepID=A0A4V1IYB1_9FUNG|nr:hypothetical protein BJ684DRAFT_9355 [Piptocephalis cylindrospora]|eukprot:RKP13939.1 hypothetical protein BJ684DRAFT_9355 [Piptocephalis cylindrospora]